MPNYKQLANAPIEEAIVNVEVDASASMDQLQSVLGLLHDEYVSNDDWYAFQGAFEINEENKTIGSSHSQEQLGFIVKTADEKQILHVGKNSLIFNKLKPYTSWEELSSMYETAWNAYTEILSPKTISKISIRYINSFEIPVQDWNTYLLMHPVINSENEQDSSSILMGEVFSRYYLKSEKYSSEAIVMLNIKANDTDKLAVIMDIDVKSFNKVVNYSGYHEIKDVIDRLRDFKNQIFFSNLPKAKELFS